MSHWGIFTKINAYIQGQGSPYTIKLNMGSAEVKRLITNDMQYFKNLITRHYSTKKNMFITRLHIVTVSTIYYL